MSTQTVYIVYGRTGEYSDRREWAVRAFRSEETARDFRQKLLDAVRELGCGRGDDRAWRFPRYGQEDIETDAYYVHLREPWRRLKDLDPNFSTQYTGTDYSYYPVPLEDAP